MGYNNDLFCKSYINLQFSIYYSILSDIYFAMKNNSLFFSVPWDI